MIRTFMRGAVAAGVLLLGCGGSAALAAQVAGYQPPIVVTGRVVEQSSGEALAGAMVQVYPTGPRAVTDASGAFQLSLRPGEYVVVASLLGCADQRVAVAVSRGAAAPLLFRLTPEPLLLEGIQVTANRFETRRQMVPMSSRVLERDRLARNGGENLSQFLLTWGGVTPAECPRDRRTIGQNCVYRRGQVIEPTIYIDDRATLGGLETLIAYRPWEMHHVEVYGRGVMIRVYTTHYVEAVARGERRLSPMTY